MFKKGKLCPGTDEKKATEQTEVTDLFQNLNLNFPGSLPVIVEITANEMSLWLLC